MRGALLITVVVATLIVGILVARNMQSDSGAGENATKREAVQHAEEAAKDIQKKIDEATQRMDRSF